MASIKYGFSPTHPGEVLKDEIEYREEVQSQELKLLGFREDLRDYLLKEFKVCLVSVQGEGYMIATPTEQIKYALKKTKDGLRSKLRKGNLILHNTDFNRVEIEEKKKASDGLAAISMIRQMVRTARI